MCLSAGARTNKLCIVVTIDQLVGVQRSAIVRCADFLFGDTLRPLHTNRRHVNFPELDFSLTIGPSVSRHCLSRGRTANRAIDQLLFDEHLLMSGCRSDNHNRLVLLDCLTNYDFKRHK